MTHGHLPRSRPIRSAAHEPHRGLQPAGRHTSWDVPTSVTLSQRPQRACF